MQRGASGLSFVVGIDKPQGCTSHDVVSRCRRIFGEKRIGHTGTLDPMASGVMAVCVGPATKLSAYLVSHDKAYLARIVFGEATDTDDAEGEVIRRAAVPATLEDSEHARSILAGIVGKHEQMPPAYSAIKVDGVKSYEAARKGRLIDLRPRPIEIHSADLAHIGRDAQGSLFWDVRFEVSAGTYIRSIARDLGISQGTCAHLAALRRVRSGRLGIGSCVSLEALESDPKLGRLDPIELLGLRYFAARGPRQEKAVLNGGAIDAEGLRILERIDAESQVECLPSAIESKRPLLPGELVAVLMDNKLAALYELESDGASLKPRCGFARGVSRGIV